MKTIGAHRAQAVDVREAGKRQLLEAYLNLGLAHEATMNGAVLGYNYPGEIWYRDAYRLLTSRGLRPTVAPADHESRLPRLLPFGKHKETTLSPPAVDASQVTQAAVPAAADAAGKPQKPVPLKKAKKGDFFHDVLGL